MAGRILLCLLLGSAAHAIDDDTSALVQSAVQVREHENWSNEGMMLEGGDMGVNMSPINLDALSSEERVHHESPVPLVEAATDFMIPALGGSASLAKEPLGFKLWRVDDGMLRTFKSVDTDGFYLWHTKAASETARGRTVLYDSATKERLGVIWMDTKDAAMRLVKMPKLLQDVRDEFAGVTYFINSYKPVCHDMGSIGEEQGSGAPLYPFAKVVKATGSDTWTVRRVQCYDKEGSHNPKWNVAYNLAHHGQSTALDAENPGVGVVGTMDSLLDTNMTKTDATSHRRYEAWLAKGEDPALFAAALMITQMPGNPKPRPIA